MSTKKFLKTGLIIAACVTMACSSAVALTACDPEEPEITGTLPHAHEWDEGEVIKEATCTEDGKIRYHCTVEGCTQTREKDIDAAHKFGEPVVIEATCEHAGSSTITCSVCHEQEVETYLRLPHNIGEDGFCTECGAPPSTSFGTEELMGLDASDSITTASFVITGTVYTVYASAAEDRTDNTAKDMAINEANTTFEQRHFDRSVYFKGKGNVTSDNPLSRVLKADYSASGTMSIWIRSNTAQHMYMWNESREKIDEYQFEDKDVHIWTVNVAAGVYYLGTDTGSASIYAIDFTEADVHVHSYSFDSHKTAATCVLPGVDIEKCSCGETREVPVDANGHNMVDGECTVCGVNTTKSADFTNLPASFTESQQLDSMFTVHATAGKAVEYKAKGDKYGVYFGGRLNSPDVIVEGTDALDAAYGRAIQITMPSKGVIYVESCKDKGTALQIVSTTEVLGTYTLTGSASTWVIEIEEAGTYYIGTTSSSAYIFGVTVEYHKDADAPHECTEYEFDSYKTEPTCTQDGIAIEKCVDPDCEETREVKAPRAHKYNDDGECTVCGVNTIVDADLSVVTSSTSDDTKIGSIFTLIWGKGWDIKNSKLHVGGKCDTASNFGRSIKIELPSNGILIFDVTSDTATEFDVYNSSAQKVSYTSVTAGGSTVWLVEIEEAGTYYFGTTSGSAYINAVTAEYHKDADAPHECTEYAFDSYKTEPTCTAGGIAIEKCVDPDCEETREVPVPRAHKLNDDGECTVCHVNTIDSLDYSSLSGTISENTNLNSIFSLVAGKGFEIKSGKLYVGGKCDTTDLAFGRSIKIEMPSSGILVFDIKSDSAADKIAVYDSEGNVVNSTSITKGGSVVWLVEIEEAGTYYFGTTSGSAYINAITAEYHAETTEGGEEQTPEATEPENNDTDAD